MTDRHSSAPGKSDECFGRTHPEARTLRGTQSLALLRRAACAGQRAAASRDPAAGAQRSSMPASRCRCDAGRPTRTSLPVHAGHADAAGDAGTDAPARPCRHANAVDLPPLPPTTRAPAEPADAVQIGARDQPGRFRADRARAQSDAQAGGRAVRGRAAPVAPGGALSQPGARLRPGSDRLVLRIEADGRTASRSRASRRPATTSGRSSSGSS